jgi:hypothetical protein
MFENYRRSKPLRKCPHLACNRGDKTCRKLAFNVECIKTHFRSQDDFADFMTRMVYDFMKKNPGQRNPNEPPLSDGEATYRMRRALEARLAQCEAEEEAAK